MGSTDQELLKRELLFLDSRLRGNDDDITEVCHSRAGGNPGKQARHDDAHQKGDAVRPIRWGFLQCCSLKENVVFQAVTPAKAGVQKRLKRLDSGFRRNDTRQLPHQAQGPK